MHIIKMTKIREHIFEKALILFGVLLVLVPTSPINMPLTYRDSGVFLYTGWRILHGEIPYLHVWDHKPPVIFFLNTLGLLIGGGSRWGVWLIELVALLLAAIIGYNLVKRVFGVLPAIFSSFLWLFSLCFLIQGGNLTTEYTLPLQFACLWLAYNAEEGNFLSWHGFLIGVLCCVSFLTKQNTIGVGIAIVLYLIVSRSVRGQFRKLLLELSTIFLGGILFLLPVIIYFWAQGAISSFWDAAFIYNFTYLSSNLEGNIQVIITGVKNLSYLAPLVFIGWSCGLALLIFSRTLSRELRLLITIGLIDLPIELIFISISGRSYEHYYMALLPIFSFFSGLVFWLLIKQISQSHHYKKSKFQVTFFVLLVFSFFHINNYLDLVRGYQRISDTSVISYIERSTTEDDSVLLWGAEAGTNFFSARVSPSRFVYQFPLYQPGYTNEKIIEEFLLNIIQNKPTLIIDTQNPYTPFFQFKLSSNNIEEYSKFLRSHYNQKEILGSWIVYEYIE